jgi:hypothetical protein
VFGFCPSRGSQCPFVTSRFSFAFSQAPSRTLRAFNSLSALRAGGTSSSLTYFAEAIPAPGAPSPKIKNLVDEISKLTLLEVAALNEQLKVLLNFVQLISGNLEH